jgi:hypothetical protein
MSADARRPRDPHLTDRIEDAALLGMMFSGAAIVVIVLLLFLLY